MRPALQVNTLCINYGRKAVSIRPVSTYLMADGQIAVIYAIICLSNNLHQFYVRSGNSQQKKYNYENLLAI